MDRQNTTDSKILRQEEWQKGAQSTITQMVSQSRFNSFIASRFVETEQRALKALPISDFDAFVASRFSSTESVASQAVPWSEFDSYVAGMKKIGIQTNRRHNNGASTNHGCHTQGHSSRGGDRFRSRWPSISSQGSRGEELAYRRLLSFFVCVCFCLWMGMDLAQTSPYSVGLQLSVFLFPLDLPCQFDLSRKPQSHPPPPNPTTPQQGIPTPGTDVFAATPHPWLHMSPDTESAWVPEALDLLVNEWSTHMDASLQQWVSKHSAPETR